MFNLIEFGKFKINWYRVGVATVCTFRQSGSGHFQIQTQGPHVSHPGQGNPACATIHQSGSMLASVADPKGLPQPSLSPPHIRGGSGWKYLPLSLSLLHTEVSTVARSSPASYCATRPFANSFGRPNPRMVALLLPQVSRSSG
jgi:hypothetical protein